MNDAQHATYVAYLRQLADLMELKDWKVFVSLEPPPNPEYVAAVKRTYGRRAGTVYFSEAFLRQSPEEQRHACVHELLHLHLGAVSEVLANVHGSVGAHAFGVLDGAMDDAIEYIVEPIANALAPFLPLPDSEPL